MAKQALGSRSRGGSEYRRCKYWALRSRREERPSQASCKREKRGRYGPGSIIGQSPSKDALAWTPFLLLTILLLINSPIIGASLVLRRSLALPLPLTLDLASISRKATVLDGGIKPATCSPLSPIQPSVSSLGQGQIRQDKTRQEKDEKRTRKRLETGKRQDERTRIFLSPHRGSSFRRSFESSSHWRD